MILTAFLLAAGSLPAIKPKVDIAGRDLRLGDLLASTNALPRPALADLVVARLPQGVRHLTLPASTVATLIHRRVPGLDVATPAFERVEVHSAASDATPHADRRCFDTLHEVAANASITLADVTPVPCRQDAGARIRYRGGAVAPTNALSAGTYLGQLAPLPAETIDAGGTLTLRSVAGPVAVERTVTAMQPGRPGQRLFVRDAEGAIFAARFDAPDRPGGAR